MGKRKVNMDLREELRDMCIETLQMLKISAKRQTYTDY